MIEAYAGDLENHLRGEEDHVAGMPRKYIPLELHKQIVRKVRICLCGLKVWTEGVKLSVVLDVGFLQ